MLVTALGIVATFVLAACGGSSDGPSGPGNTAKDPTGSYVISTVNGKTLPYALIQSDTVGQYLYQLLSGSSSFTTDGKYLMVFNYRQTVLGSTEDFVDTLRGTWTLAGTTVTLTDAFDPANNDRAEWSSSGTLTLDEFYEPTSDSLKVLFTLKR